MSSVLPIASSSSTCRRHCTSSSKPLEAPGATATWTLLRSAVPSPARAPLVACAVPAVCDCDCPAPAPTTIPGRRDSRNCLRRCCPHAATVRGIIPPRSGSRQCSACRTAKAAAVPVEFAAPHDYLPPRLWLAPLGSDSSPLQAAARLLFLTSCLLVGCSSSSRQWHGTGTADLVGTWKESMFAETELSSCASASAYEALIPMVEKRN